MGFVSYTRTGSAARSGPPPASRSKEQMIGVIGAVEHLADLPAKHDDRIADVEHQLEELRRRP